MKCLSVHQPWADLEVDGERSIEVRSWAVNHRGLLLIHSGLKVEKEECKRLGVKPGITGAIIGCVDIADIRHVSEKEWKALKQYHLEKGRRCYGKETFCWFTRSAKRFPRPIPYKGRLGLFEIPDKSSVGKIIRKAIKNSNPA